MKKTAVFVFLVAAALIAFAVVSRPFSAAACGNAQGAEEPEAASAPPAEDQLPGARETLVLAQAYQNRIAERAFRNNDWALRIDGAWYAWAHGRMLPEAEKDRWGEFTGLRFYKYPRGLPPVARLDEEAKTRLRERLAADREKPPVRSEAFLSSLFGASTREEAESQLVPVRLAGFSFPLHRMAAESLGRVDKDLAALDNAEVRRFLEGIRHIGSFNWRPIAGTASRSYHAYGLALDFIAKSWGGRPYYWRSIMNADENWFELPYEKRWMVPLPLVEVFEKHGFIWGGKWLYFDTVHFEYRPELLALNPAE
jgi:hypothetical protein